MDKGRSQDDREGWDFDGGGEVKVLVCGGRKFCNGVLLFKTLDGVLSKYGDDLFIIHGSAPGADIMAERWAKSRNVPYFGFPAKWKKHGKSAGPIRNKFMRDIAKPDQCIAFEGGDGTKGMIELMREIGVDPWLVGWRSEIRG